MKQQRIKIDSEIDSARPPYDGNLDFLFRGEHPDGIPAPVRKKRRYRIFNKRTSEYEFNC